jgi:hypothetical protein
LKTSLLKQIALLKKFSNSYKKVISAAKKLHNETEIENTKSKLLQYISCLTIVTNLNVSDPQKIAKIYNLILANMISHIIKEICPINPANVSKQGNFFPLEGKRRRSRYIIFLTYLSLNKILQ